MTSKPRWRVLARKLQVYLYWRNTNVRPQPLGCLASRTGPLNPGDRQPAVPVGSPRTVQYHFDKVFIKLDITRGASDRLCK